MTDSGRAPAGVSVPVSIDELHAVIFDMDGVVTDTASVHASAWKRLFDGYLADRAERTGEALRPFDTDRDYREYVDGKPRYDGVRDFLRSRDITLPEGDIKDPPERETVRGLGNRKDTYFLEHVRTKGVERYPGTVELVNSLKRAGVGVAIISASRNLAEVLTAAGAADLFDVRVDGVEADRLGLKGKPDPAVFVEAARRLRVEPSRAAVVEDALAGVEAGRRGGFRLVVGVDRVGYAHELLERGADVVVRDPGELLAWSTRSPTPDAPAPAFPEPTADASWLLEVVGFDAVRERDVESWLTVANGRIGTRGSLEEGSEESSPATYVAGVYGTGEAGRLQLEGIEWPRLFPRVGDESLDLDRGQVLEHRRVLDLRQGIVFRYWRQRLPSGPEVTFRSARYASLADRDVLALEAFASAGDRRARLAGGVLPPPRSEVVQRAEIRVDGNNLTATLQGRQGGAAAFAVTTMVGNGSVARLVGIGRSAPGEPLPRAAAKRALQRARASDVSALREAHRAAWEARWRDADVEIDGDADAQRALRFALYHLISSGDPDSDMASIGARGLTGPGYKGHVFWDTDVFVLPFLIYTHPATARALLAYRYRTLPAARARAAALGYRGALFAWESADTGEDVTPERVILDDGRVIEVLTGAQEHHIAADVAWAVWRYWEATADDEFMREMGAEIVLETARFWASRVRRDRDGRYHINEVIGPDEYHEGVRDNAFTNVLARWNLERGVELAERLRSSDRARWRVLARHLELTARDVRRWTAVADGLVDGFNAKTLCYEQFAGFFDLEDVRAVDIHARPFAGDVVLGVPRVRRSQVVKQADVLMLAHMLPEVVPPEVAAANYAYYEPRTSHGSSLSAAVHGAVAARIGRVDDALAYVRMAAAIDLGNNMGNASQGVHIATTGGLWQAAVIGFGGVRAAGAALRIDPTLPAGWTRLAFPVRWRGTRVEVAVRRDLLTVTLDGPVELGVGTNDPQPLEAGRYEARRMRRRWSRLQPDR